MVDSQWVEPLSLIGHFIGSVLPLSFHGNYKWGYSAGIYGAHISLREIMTREPGEKYNANVGRDYEMIFKTTKMASKNEYCKLEITA